MHCWNGRSISPKKMNEISSFLSAFIFLYSYASWIVCLKWCMHLENHISSVHLVSPRNCPSFCQKRSRTTAIKVINFTIFPQTKHKFVLIKSGHKYWRWKILILFLGFDVWLQSDINVAVCLRFWTLIWLSWEKVQ